MREVFWLEHGHPNYEHTMSVTSCERPSKKDLEIGGGQVVKNVNRIGESIQEVSVEGKIITIYCIQARNYKSNTKNFTIRSENLSVYYCLRVCRNIKEVTVVGFRLH